MKRIITILSLVAMMLVSGMTYADDINILLRNNRDAITEGSDDKKTQVLFLVDLLASGAAYDKFKCYDMNPDGSKGGLWKTTGTCPDDDNNVSSCVAGCYDASGATSNGFQFNNDRLAYDYPPGNCSTVPENNNKICFKGCFCPDGFEGGDDSDGYIKETINVTPGVTDVRPVIAKIMQQHPDLKYGVMALKDDKTAVQIFPVKARTETEVLALVDPTDTSAGQLYDINFPTLKQPLDAAAVFPTVGGMISVKGYLSGDDSPLTDLCLNTQLVIITNGGWKGDMDTPDSSDNDVYLPALTATLSHEDGNVKSGCPARVITNVLGINVPENDSTNIPLFNGGDASVAKTMADNGKGIYKNVTSSQIDQNLKNTEIGTGLYNAILGVVDFNREEATALITPVAPVSITRGYSLSTLYASSFEAKDGVNWPGNITRGDIDSIPASNFDLSHFTLPAAVDRKIKTIVGGSITDLTADPDISQADIDWLKGGTTGTDLLGDIIHFRPLPIHYGDLEAEPNGVVNDNELYVAVGSNRGLLHMFNKSGVEQWAFLPPQLKPMIKALREDYTAPGHSMINHFYGVDGAPSVFIYDANKDGKIKYSDSDKVYLYFGLRRGGAGYIALDITRPASPNYLDNLWQLGGSDLNYGNKPEADIDNSDIEERSDKTIAPPGTSEGCPVFACNAQSCATANAGAGVIGVIDKTDYYTKITEEHFDHWPNIGPGGSGVYDFGHLYFAGVCGVCDQGDGANPVCVEHCAGHNGEPVFTVQNQCVADIDSATDLSGNKVTSWTFDAHVSAMSPFGYSLAQKCDVGATLSDTVSSSKQAPTFSGATGVGDLGSLIANSGTVVGFELSGLPDNITITSAQITFAHNGKGDVNPKDTYDTDKVYVYASSKGFIGNTTFPDGEIDATSTIEDTDDCRDTSFFDTGISNDSNRVARIQKPASGSYGLGERTTDGMLLTQITDDTAREAKLTDLFAGCSSDGKKPCFIDDYRNEEWVQFKVMKGISSESRVAWARAIAGAQATNWNESDYWNYMPHLNLTWCYTGSKAVGGCEYTEPAGPVLNIEIAGGGEVAVVKESESAATCETSACKYTDYAVGDKITLTATADSSYVFKSWDGCIPQSNPAECAITIAAGANNVTANFIGESRALAVTVADASGVTVMAFVGVSNVNVGYNAIGGYNGGVPAGSSVTLAAYNIPVDKEVLSWTGFPAAVDHSCGAAQKCTFIMPAENVAVTVTFKDTPTNPTVTLISEGVGGTASLTTTQPMEIGAKAQISISVDDGYEVDISGGTCPEGSTVGSTYTTGDITEDCSVKVVFKFECKEYYKAMYYHASDSRATKVSCGSACSDYTLVGSLQQKLDVKNLDKYYVREVNLNHFEFGQCPD